MKGKYPRILSNPTPIWNIASSRRTPDSCADDESGHFGNDVKLGTYVATTKGKKEVLTLLEDSSFVDIEIDASGDTLKKENGRYLIRRTPDNEWTKGREIYGFIFESADSSAFRGDSVLVDVSDSCFSLGIENRNDFCPKDYYYTVYRKFCMEAK